MSAPSKCNSLVKMGLLGVLLVLSMSIAANVFADSYEWEDCSLDLGLFNDSILSLAADEDYLYAGTYNSYFFEGAEVWRSSSSTYWTQCNVDGFGDVENGRNGSIECLAVFGDYIIAGTSQEYEPAFDTAAELWSSIDGTTWNRIYDHSSLDNREDSFSAMAVSDNFLFVGTSSTSGGAIFRISNTLDVELTRFPRNPENTTIYALCYLGEGGEGNVLIAGTGNPETRTTGAMISFSEDDGENWLPIMADWLGDNISVRSLGLFYPYLYVGTHNNAGAEIWRTDDGATWESCCDNGFGNANNTMVKSLCEFNGYLYAGTRNVVQGAELWRSADGLTWEKFNENGFGDSAITEINCLLGFHNRLYAGTTETAMGPTSKLYSNDGMLNVISSATVTASTYHAPIGAYTYEPDKAMDGIYGAWDAYEWASDGEMDPWIKFNWSPSEARTINRIVLYDRCNPVDHIADAWLYLNRGGSTVSAIHLGMFPYGGAAKEVVFDPVTVDEIYIDIVSGWGLNVGLSEVQAYYDPTVESRGNLIRTGSATVTASSNHGPIGAYTYEPGNAMDGIHGAWDVHEWASDGEMDPWIKFNWSPSEAQTINKIVLYDRCNPVDHILDAWLYLNRGGSTVSAIHLGMFPYGGAAKEVIFDPVTVDEIYIDIVSGRGLNIGLSEVEAYYDPAVEFSGNLLLSGASVVASTYHSPIGAFTYEPENAMDGIYGAWDAYEWASDGEMDPWIVFWWDDDEPRTINRIVLYDRCNPVDHIVDAWLFLDRDGFTVQEIHLGMFPFGGAAKEVIFDPVSVDTIYVIVTDGWGLNVGLSEVEAYYE